MTDVYEYKAVKTKKEHNCYFCHRKIPKGFTATHGKGIYQGDFFNTYFCNTCTTLTKEFPDYMTDSDGGYSDWEYDEARSWYDCSTPLQLLNALRKEYEKITDEAREYARNVFNPVQTEVTLSTENIQIRLAIAYEHGKEEGLAEGRKEGYEQGKNNERELQCGKKNYEKDISKLEKENAELEEIRSQQTRIINNDTDRIERLKKEIAKLSKMLEMSINEVLLCGKQMKAEHPSMIVWTEETFRAELEKRVENEK